MTTSAVHAAPPPGFDFVAERIHRHVNDRYVTFLRRVGLNFIPARAEGAVVYDTQGRRLIDCIAGYGNLNVGHNHPHVVAAMMSQLQSGSVFNWPFLSEAQAQLASRLTKLTGGKLDRCFLVNSGSEAVDTALKLIRLATGRPHVVAARGAWHGFTLGALSVSEPAMRTVFGNLLPEVTHVPFGDSGAIQQALTPRTGCVILEPIQCESGVRESPPGYLRDVAELCTENGIVLILDEIKTGMGKTGRYFACEHEHVMPDVILTGKSLGGGLVPIGAILARGALWSRFGYSFAMSSSSAAGNAPACAVALAVLDLIDDRWLKEVRRKGAILLAALRRLAAQYPKTLCGSSGRGLLAALHCRSPRVALDIAIKSVARGLLILPAFGMRSRILIEPPLCIQDEDLACVIEILSEAVNEAAGEPGGV